jgi:Protein of unknown function (DUF1203)
MKPEFSFYVQPLAEAFVARVRSSLIDDFGRQVCTMPAKGGEPLRDQLRRAAPGEPIILCSYQAVPLPSAYAEVGPIFISAADESPPQTVPNALPSGYFTRTFALRGYNASNEIVESTLTTLSDALDAIHSLLSVPDVCCLHARFAGHGCFAARIVLE